MAKPRAGSRSSNAAPDGAEFPLKVVDSTRGPSFSISFSTRALVEGGGDIRGIADVDQTDD